MENTDVVTLAQDPYTQYSDDDGEDDGTGEEEPPRRTTRQRRTRAMRCVWRAERWNDY